MRRPVLMGGLVALVAVVLPTAALAHGSVATDRPRHEAPSARESTPGGVSCALLPAAAAEDPAPVGFGPCPGVRPGGRVVTTVGDCTLNFLFRTPDGTRYIGTAGHCVDPGPVSNEESNPDGKARVERVWTLGKGPVAVDSDGQRFGEFAYAVVRPSKDFALIRLDPGVEASPEMCHFGAPRGLSTTDFDTAVVLRYYGHGAESATWRPPARRCQLAPPTRITSTPSDWRCRAIQAPV